MELGAIFWGEAVEGRGLSSALKALSGHGGLDTEGHGQASQADGPGSRCPCKPTSPSPSPPVQTAGGNPGFALVCGALAMYTANVQLD